MVRHKRIASPFTAAKQYLQQHLPALSERPMHLRVLDGPANAPRYAITIELCPDAPCPRGVPAQVAWEGECAVQKCALRRTIRLLVNQEGEVVRVSQSQVRWK